MPSVRYTNVGGEIIAEKRNNVRSLYVPDPLGSTVALLDNTQTQTDQWSYMPYGESTRIKGTNPTPFLFVGTKGYHNDNTTRTYIRARILEPPKGRWMTEDSVGFDRDDSNLYGYVGSGPTSQVDPSGNSWCCAVGLIVFCASDDKTKTCHKDWADLVKKLGPIFKNGNGDKYLADHACPLIKKWLTGLTHVCGVDLMAHVADGFCSTILWFEKFCTFSEQFRQAKLEPYANGCGPHVGLPMPPGDPPPGWG